MGNGSRNWTTSYGEIKIEKTGRSVKATLCAKERILIMVMGWVSLGWQINE